MAASPQVLARGPWDSSELQVAWCSDRFQPDASASANADRLLRELKDRGSPSYDGLAARLVSYEATGAGLKLYLQPIRWALRLLADDAGSSISALCVVRDSAGRWLAGHRAEWVASWAGRWALGAAGAVEVDENPAFTLRRELAEEWSVSPDQIAIEALIRLRNGMVMLVGQASIPEGTEVTPDDEHDGYAWWPADVSQWPPEADPQLRMIGLMLSGG